MGEPGAGASCPDDETFGLLLDGRLAAAQVRALQVHLDACERCMALLITLGRPGGDALPRTERAPPARTEAPTQVGEYQLLRPLGQGAMGQVFLARDTLLDRLVALKLLSGPEPSAAARERFLIEARAIARLDHPNVVAVYRVGEDAGRPYLVSELVPGRSLDQVPLPMPAERVIRIGLGLCQGLDAVHQRGVLHRDVKPANVMLTEEGEVKLLDFGLAKLHGDPPQGQDEDPGDESRASARLAGAVTAAGTIVGTPRYLAPEIWRGAAATAQSDLYSLGALLYELCAGRPPHQARTLRALSRQARHKDAPPLREVARGVGPLAEIIDRCLRRQAAERFASAAELGQALAALLPAPEVAASAPPPPSPRAPRPRASAAERALRRVRAAEIAAVSALLRAQGLVTVVGDAGSGKSSLCASGVLPALGVGAPGERRWAVLPLRPEVRPLAQLAARLAPWLGTGEAELQRRLQAEPAALLRQIGERAPQTEVLLFVDEAERLVTQSEAAEAAALGAVLGALAAGVPGVRALLTLRGEFLARLATLPGLGNRVSRGLYLLAPLSVAGALAQVRRGGLGNAEGARRLGAAYLVLRHFDAAAALLEHAVALAPQDARARQLLARAYAATEDLTRARAEAGAAVRLSPGQVRALCLLGRLCLRDRRFPEACEALRQVLTLMPAHRQAQRWLGEALLALGETAEAASCFEQAAALRLARLTGRVAGP